LKHHKWQALITVDGNTRHTIGLFVDEVEAAYAYDTYTIANGITYRATSPRNRKTSAPTPTAKKPKAAASKTSRFHGVTWRKDIKMWRLTINISGVTKYMAHFDEEDQAARTFDNVVVRNNFDLPLNFPDDAVKEEGASS